jgi:hypothetical protein
MPYATASPTKRKRSIVNPHEANAHLLVNEYVMNADITPSLTVVPVGSNPPWFQPKASSSEQLIAFLHHHHLHKKDFADMIGVTLSYVYNLIDPNLAFSSRSSTLERIAVVMSLAPEQFTEYRLPDEPKLMDPGVLFMQQQQRKIGLANLSFLKRFPRDKRMPMVDMWRGVLPLPLDWSALMAIALVLGLNKNDIYPFWEARFRQYLSDGGLDAVANHALTQAIIQGSKQQLGVGYPY